MYCTKMFEKCTNIGIMFAKNYFFVQKYVKIKLIRGKGQKTYECSQKEWLESKCSRKCSPTAHCIVEGPQKFAKIRDKGQKVYECSQKYSLSTYYTVEDPQKLAKMFMIEYRWITKMFAKRVR